MHLDIFNLLVPTPQPRQAASFSWRATRYRISQQLELRHSRLEARTAADA